jgi:hypothetical protein
MNVGKGDFGYGDNISYFVLFLTVLLSGMVGHDIAIEYCAKY